MTVEILTPETKLFEGEASYVGLPGSDGSLGILENHAPLITTLKEGKVVVRTSSGDQVFDVSGGSVEVLKNKVTILAE